MIVTIGGRVRVRGTATAVRRVFYTRLGGTTVAADRCEVLGPAVGPGVDEQVLAARLLPPGVLHELERRSVWQGITGVPADHCLVLEPDGHAATRRWWRRVRLVAGQRCREPDWFVAPTGRSLRDGVGPHLRLPPWATSSAVQTARDLLRELAQSTPEPLSPQRAQHTAGEFIWAGAGRLRHIDQATTRWGVPYAAPCLDDAVVEATLSVRLSERADEHTGRYWQLNDNGTLILRRLLDGDTPQTCALRLVRDHPRLTEEQADTDVATLLESLRMAHLVTP
ncbi:PqqD family peptide modification chaperone [Streptomyces nigrescens]